MLQNKFEMPLDLAIKPSKILKTYLVVIFLLAVISILISVSLPLNLRLLLLFVLLMMTFVIVEKQKSNSISRLRLSHTDEWELDTSTKNNVEVELIGECIVTYFLVWLNFTSIDKEGKSKVFHLLLLPDSADNDLLRQLRVRLRFLKSSTTRLP